MNLTKIVEAKTRKIFVQVVNQKVAELKSALPRFEDAARSDLLTKWPGRTGLNPKGFPYTRLGDLANKLLDYYIPRNVKFKFTPSTMRAYVEVWLTTNPVRNGVGVDYGAIQNAVFYPNFKQTLLKKSSDALNDYIKGKL
jgi:hypothetical protein